MRKNLIKQNNNLVTRDYLDKKLRNFVTKDYLDKRFKEERKWVSENVIDRFMKYLDHKLGPLYELKKEFDKFKDSTNKTLDWLVKSQEKYDQEYTAMSARNDRIDVKLDNHDTRISVLEKKSSYKTS